MNREVWDKMSTAEQDDVGAELEKILREEINKEIIREIQRKTARNKLGNKFK